MIDLCREITPEYQTQFQSLSVQENAETLGISALQFVCASDAVFLAIIRAHPLECMALIDQGDIDVREVGNARIPDDVWGQLYGFMMGFDVDEHYLSLGKKERSVFLDVIPDVSRKELNRLTPEEAEDYLEYITVGVQHKRAYAIALFNHRTAVDQPTVSAGSRRHGRRSAVEVDTQGGG